MKNHNEMYQSLLSRYEEHQEKKNRRIRMIRLTVPVLACFCLTIVLGLGYWNNFHKLQDIPGQSGIIEETATEATEAVTSAVPETRPATRVTETARIAETTSATASGTNTERAVSATEIRTQTTAAAVTAAEKTETVPAADKPAETQIPATEATAADTAAVTVTQTTEQVQTTETTPSATVNPNIKEVRFGYPKEEETGYYAPSSSKKIVMKCMSFCEPGETLSVEVAMADMTLRPDGYDAPVNYEYLVYICNTLNYQNAEDDRFIVNGQRKGYTREYSKDETPLFDINREEYNYDLYHHEMTELDFSGFTAGDSGCIAFVFRAAYKEDPLHQSYLGSNQFMYFYVGEEGTAVSELSIEDAMDNYQAVTGAYPERS